MPCLARRLGCRGNDAVRLAPAVEQDGPRNVAPLQLSERLLVAVAHDLPGAARMVQADGVADLVGDGVAHVVGAQIAVEADLPALLGIEADERLRDRLDGL